MNLIHQLVLLRHATRSSFSLGTASELPLNAVGFAQAEDLVNAVEARRALPRPTILIASPKLRARQTLEPLARALDLEIEVIDALDERRDDETQREFEARVREALASIRALFPADRSATVYACTHLDVLEAAALHWPSDFSERESRATWSTLEYQILDARDSVLKTRARGRIEPRG